jgi:site-specific DNA-methyltransferase (adenine-specific)
MPISEVYNMGCMEYMKDIPNAFYDLAIIAPPYGIGEDGLKNHSRGNRAKAKKNYLNYEVRIKKTRNSHV